MKNLIVIFVMLLSMTLSNNTLSAQSEKAMKSEQVSQAEKPEMIVISANYGLLFGYTFFVEHRGSKRTGRKSLYKRIEDDIIDMGNPSDAMNFMNDYGYDLETVYSFPKDLETTTINYVFKKR